MAYIDTSVLIAYYCPEPLSPTAERHVRRARPPVISPLTEAEFCSALAIKVRTGGLAVDDARRVLAQFRTHCREHAYRIVPLGASEYTTACEWLETFTTALRTADALHLAVAVVNELTILTADQAMARAAKQLGIDCTHVR